VSFEKATFMAQDPKPIVVDAREGYLSITLPAYESPEKKRAQISAVYDAVHQHNARRLLIDCRATKRLIPVLDLYDLCLFMVSTFGPMDIRIAVLVSPEAAYPDRFGENVLRNRGLDLIRFMEDEHNTLEWLLSDRNTSEDAGARI
jgi:hypothetical protein